jgi:hypothetical protein
MKTEYDDDIETGGEEVIITKGKARNAFAKVRKELSEEELSQSGVHKFLINEIERLEESEGELSLFRERFYKADKTAAVLQENLKTNTASEILYSLCVAIGASMLGLTVGLWEFKPYGYISLGIGISLLVLAIISKIKRGKKG